MASIEIFVTDGQVGPAGQDGQDGQNGSNGTDGKSAYQEWIDLGNTGTEADFINSLKGPKGDPGEVGPAGLEWKGSWAALTTYIEDDAVGYGGASYFCILGITGNAGNSNPETDTTHWALLASQGAKGDTGDQGPQGVPGQDGADGVDGVDGADGQDIAILAGTESPSTTWSHANTYKTVTMTAQLNISSVAADMPTGPTVGFFINNGYALTVLDQVGFVSRDGKYKVMVENVGGTYYVTDCWKAYGDPIAPEIVYDTTTLGITSEFPSGASSATIRRRAQKVYPAADGFIDSISIRHSSDPSNVLVGIYADNAGSPGALLAISTSQATDTNGSQEWTTHDLDSPFAITKGTPVWIAWVYESATTTYYSNSLYGTSALVDAAGTGYSLADPFGTPASQTLAYSAYANVRYNDATYNYIINEDFTNWSAGLPVGWTLNNSTDASNYVEENANGVRFVTASLTNFGIKIGGLTNGQVYFCEIETYSISTLGIDLYTATKFGDPRQAGKRTFVFTASGTDFKLLRPGGAAECIIKSVKVWQ